MVGWGGVECDVWFLCESKLVSGWLVILLHSKETFITLLMSTNDPWNDRNNISLALSVNPVVLPRLASWNPVPLKASLYLFLKDPQCKSIQELNNQMIYKLLKWKTKCQSNVSSKLVAIHLGHS